MLKVFASDVSNLQPDAQLSKQVFKGPNCCKGEDNGDGGELEALEAIDMIWGGNDRELIKKFKLHDFGELTSRN